jgi:hypothetical protein
VKRSFVRTALAASLLGFALVGVAGAGCYLDNPAPSARSESGAGDAAVDASSSDTGGADAVSPPPADDAGPALCTKYGGYATVEAVVDQLVGALVADCRISPFFTTLAAPRVAHVRDCLVKQVAVVLGCPGIRYDVDNAGVECRDMKTSHKTLSIRQADFDALVQDLVAVLVKSGVAQTDIDAIAPSILALRNDIVTNSAPGSGHAICDAGGDR